MSSSNSMGRCSQRPTVRRTSSPARSCTEAPPIVNEPSTSRKRTRACASVVFPAPLEPTTSTRSPARTSRSMSCSDGTSAPGHRGRHAAHPQTRTDRRALPGGRNGLGDELWRQFGRQSLRDAGRTRAHLPPGGGGEGNRAEHLEDRHRHEHGDGEQRRSEAALGVLRRGDDQRRDRGHPGQQRHDRGRTRLTQRPPHDRPAHGGIGLADALAGGVLCAEGDQHVEASEVVEHGIRQSRSQRRELALGTRTRGPPPQRRCDGRGDQAPEQRQGCGPRDEDHEHDGCRRHQRRGDQRLHDAQRQVLQLVDVVHERTEDRPAPRAAEPVGRERDQSAHERGARRGELPQRGVVPEQPLEIAEARAGECEQAHPDDSGGEVEQERLLARAHDEPRAHGEQRDRGGLGQKPRGGSRPEAAQRRHGAPQDVGRGRRSVAYSSCRHLASLEAHDLVCDRARSRAVRDEQNGGSPIGEAPQVLPQSRLGRRRRGRSSAHRARSRSPAPTGDDGSRARRRPAEPGRPTGPPPARPGRHRDRGRLPSPARAPWRRARGRDRDRRARRSRRWCPRSGRAAGPTTRASGRGRGARRRHRRRSRSPSTARRRGARRRRSTFLRRSVPRSR